MVNVRRVEIEDAVGFITLNQVLAKETKLMMRELDECATDAEVAKKIIEDVQKNDDFLFVAEVDREIVGFIMAVKGNMNRIKHRAYIVIGIRKAYQGQGVGNRFFEALEKWAMDQGLRRLELTVMTHNVAGKALYEKHGFVVEGVKKDSMCVDGEYVDEYYMGKLIE